MADEPSVLVVDDDIEVAEVTCEILAAAGLAAIYRTNVSDAMDVLVRYAGSINALVTDINLSSPMSGIELAVYVAQEWPGVGICVMSGITAERPRRIPESAVFLAKPWRSLDLVAFLQTCSAPERRSAGGTIAGGS